MDILFELMEDYLVDQEDGMKKLLSWFLNLVMQREADLSIHTASVTGIRLVASMAIL